MMGLIATGGMAEVYLALSGELTGFRTLVVVKRILPHLASNKEFVRMFSDEARIVALLDHPNIVRIIEVGQDRDEYFLAMDLVQGKPLSALIRKSVKNGTPLTQTQSAFLVAQAANGLGHAHGLVDAGGLPLNIVHRDVSPQNILVSYAGVVKIIDFGVARVMGRSSVTRPGGLKGKIHYMSPEQAASGRVDRRSDVFALGVVLWEALCGRRPFRRDTELETLRAVVEEAIPAPSKFVRIPARLENIVMRALERNPANRFQTAQEMALALERFAFASPEFNPAQIPTLMKGLFASDVTRWKKTVSTVKTLEGEPEQWTNTSGTYLHPEGIDLTTRGSTVALHPVPHTPRPLVSTQELLSISPSLPSIGFNLTGPLRMRRSRTIRIGGVALGAVTLALGLLLLRHPQPPMSPNRDRPGSGDRASAMRIEALPRQDVPRATNPQPQPPGPATSPAPASDVPSAVDQDPPPLKAIPRLDSEALPAAGPDEVSPAAAAAVREPRTPAPSIDAFGAELALAGKHGLAGTGSRSRLPDAKATEKLQRSVPPAATAKAVPAAHRTQRVDANARCFIRVGTKPWSEIWIDGRNTKQHTPYSHGIDCGRHVLTFRRPDLHLVKTFRVTAVAGDTLTQAFSLRDE